MILKDKFILLTEDICKSEPRTLGHITKSFLKNIIKLFLMIMWVMHSCL